MMNMSGAAFQLLEILTHEWQSRDELREKLAHVEGGKWVRPSDRTLREAVNELRHRGYPVVSNSQSKGYKWGNKAEVEHTVKEYESRSTEARQVAEAMRKGPDCGQIELEV